MRIRAITSGIVGLALLLALVACSQPAPSGVTSEELRSVVQEAVAQSQPPPAPAPAGPSAEEIRAMLQTAVEGAVPEGTSAEEISAMVEAAVEAAQQPALSPADIEKLLSTAVMESTADSPEPLSASEVQGIVTAAISAIPTPAPVVIPTPETIVVVATPEPMMMELTDSKFQRVSIALPPPDTQNNRIWSGPWGILVQHDPYGETLLGNESRTSASVPMLAKSWEVSNGFKTWSFGLQEGVQWDGGFGEFTSADVIHTRELLVREDSISTFKSPWKTASATADGDYGVTFNFDPPMIDGTRLFSRQGGDLIIHSKAQWDAAGGDASAYDDAVAGTGSYRFAERQVDQNVVYERVDGHWAGVNPDFQELEWVWAAEDFTRQALLLSGRVQGANLSRELRQGARASGMKIVSSNNQNNMTIGIFGGMYLNSGNEHYMGPEPFHDIRVREAANRAIDRDAILDEIFFGDANQVSIELMTPFNEGWSDRWVEEFDAKYGYDPDRARELIAEYEAEHGDIEITLNSTTFSGNEEMPVLTLILADFWEAIGITTEVQPLDSGEYNRQLQQHDMHNKFAISRNSPIRTVQEGLRVFFYSLNHAFQHDTMDAAYECLLNSVNAQERDDCARTAGNFIFDEYAAVPLFQITYDITVDPVYISEWQYPGVGSAHPTHVHNIRACLRDRCD